MSPAADPERADLDGRILAWMREDPWREDEPRFDTLARELFAFQVARSAPYARFCAGREVTPERVGSWRDIPAVPTGAFKEVALRSFPAGRTVRTFRTSGTTTRRRGELHLDTTGLYDASVRAAFLRHLLPDLAALGGRIRMRILAASPAELPDSSLSHMFGVVIEDFGAAGSGFDVEGGELRAERLLGALAEAGREPHPVLLAGTAFAFVHLLDQLTAARRRIALPAGSRIMETGGFKGRSREVSREELHAALETALGVARSHVVNQYGMTELGSQFYDSSLREPGAPRRKLAPPWTRVRLLDPETGAEATEGVVTILDLANTGSVLAVETADLGRRIGDGFEVLARVPGAEERGCSIAADAMLAEART